MPTLDFKGKPFVYSHHLSVPFRELKIDAGKSLLGDAGPSLDDNLIIHGDNLHALKALLPKYAGKVDVIYIDPPYNTGNEGWAYNDNVNSPLMKEWLGKVVDSEDLERHDKWLCMIWPRLVLLRELLADDGAVFISIDDGEVSNLKTILFEIFPEFNFEIFIWKSRQMKDTRPLSNVSNDHEYVLAIFSSNFDEFLGDSINTKKYKNPDKDPRGEWFSNNILGLADEKGRPNLHYSIVNPDTGHRFSPPAKSGWRYGKETMSQKIKERRILFPNNPDGRPREKKYLAELKKMRGSTSSVLDSEKVGYTATGTRELREIDLEANFVFAKPSKLVAWLIKQTSGPNALILDSFAGSGTTAHAVQALNAEDGGNRKFILVETEDYADTITAERVRRVMQGVPSAKDEALKNGLGGSFTYCDLGDPIDMESFFGDSKSMPAYDQLASYIAYTATGEALGKAPKKPAKDWFIGEVGGVRLHLIYKPDSAFMKSHDAALDMDTVKIIAAGNKTGKPSYVFAAAKYMGQSELTRDYDMTFCQLPYAIHRIMGDGVEV